MEFTYLDRDGRKCDPLLIVTEIPITVFESFLSRISRDTTVASVTPLTPGRSGASVFLVRRVAHSAKQSPIVVKVANDASLIVRESDNYQQYVKDSLPYAPNLAESDSLALAYTYAGATFDSPQTLREGYIQTETKTLLKLLNRLARILHDWYFSTEDVLSNAEHMELGRLDEVLATLGPEFSAYSFLAQWWYEFQNNYRFKSPHTRFRSHGDLNAGNVMYDGASPDPVPLLIDFGSVGDHIAFWDYAKLDRDIKTRLYLKHAIAHNRTFEEMAKTVVNADLGDPNQLHADPLTNLGEPERKVFGCLDALRKQVVRLRGEDLFERAYYHTLVYATLQVLYRDTPDLEGPLVLQKKLACESAAALLSRLLQRPLPRTGAGSLPPLPAFEEVPLNEVTRVTDLTPNEFLDFVSRRIVESPESDLSYAAIAGREFFKSQEINNAIEALSSGSQEDVRQIRIYLLRPNTVSFGQFTQRSNEPEDALETKTAETIEALRSMARRLQARNIKILLFLYDALPSMSILKLGSTYYVRSYTLGRNRGKFDLVHISSNNDPGGITGILDNYLSDLELRSQLLDLLDECSEGASNGN
jgi:hypothetical protein